MKETKTVLIAGGSGLIGTNLANLLRTNGFAVKFLSRQASSDSCIHWNPKTKEINVDELADVNVIVNLAGANIGDRNWTQVRKKELVDSRIESTLFLSELAPKMPGLLYYIGASGVNCFDVTQEKTFHEEDPYGTDFLSQLVKEWEAASDSFQGVCPYMKLRIAMVLAKEGGSLDAMRKPISLGLGSPLGKGTQYHPWIHIDDLARLMLFGIENALTGTYHAVANCDQNKTMMKEIAREMKKPFFLPPVPGFLLKWLLGERAMLVLSDLTVSNQKIKQTGFTFHFEHLTDALKSIFAK